MVNTAFLLIVSSVAPGWIVDEPQPKPDPEQQAATAIKESLGVEFSVLESKIRRSIIRTKTPYGFKISKVEKDSVADKAGWKAGDILLEFNEKPLKTLGDLNNGIQKARADGSGKYKLSRYKKNVPITSRQPWETVEGKVTMK